MVKPTAKFGNEMWAVTKLDVTRLGTGERERLWIYGPAVEQGMWRIRIEEELWELHKDLDIAADIKREIRMNWTWSKNR